MFVAARAKGRGQTRADRCRQKRTGKSKRRGQKRNCKVGDLSTQSEHDINSGSIDSGNVWWWWFAAESDRSQGRVREKSEGKSEARTLLTLSMSPHTQIGQARPGQACLSVSTHKDNTRQKRPQCLNNEEEEEQSKCVC